MGAAPTILSVLNAFSLFYLTCLPDRRGAQVRTRFILMTLTDSFVTDFTVMSPVLRSKLQAARGSLAASVTSDAAFG